MSRSDLMYTKDNTLYVMDYKNTKGGKATGDQIYQVAHYLQDINQLRGILNKEENKNRLDQIREGNVDENIFNLYKNGKYAGESYFKNGKATDT